MKALNIIKSRRSGVHISIPIVTVLVIVLGAFLNPFRAHAQTNIRGEPYEFETEDEFLIYAENDTGIPNATTQYGKQANWEMYENYGNIVFGDPSGRTKEIKVEGKDMIENPCGLPKGVTVHENIGYNIENEPVPNSCFPNDAYGGTHPTNWNWNTVSGAKDSWNTLTPAQEKHISNSILYGNGSDDENPLYVTDIAPTYKEFVRIDVPPTWKGAASVYTENGGRYHASFTVKEMGGSSTIDGNITTDQDSYVLKQGEQKVQGTLTVTAEALLDGYMAQENISELKASWTSMDIAPTGENRTITGENTSVTGQQRVSHSTDQLIFNRSDYPEGEYDITLNGEVYVRSAYGDEETKEVSKTIQLSVEAPQPPKEEARPIGLEVRPKEARIQVGKTYQFRAFLLYDDGGEKEVTQSIQTGWEVTDESVGTIDTDGLFTAKGSGELQGTVTHTVMDGQGNIVQTFESTLLAGQSNLPVKKGKPRPGIIRTTYAEVPDWNAEERGQPYKIRVDIRNIPFTSDQWKYVFIRLEKVVEDGENIVVSEGNLAELKNGSTKANPIIIALRKAEEGTYRIIEYVK